MLSGGASRVEGFAEALRERFDTTVELFDPFRQVTFDVKQLGVSARGNGAAGGGGARSRAATGGGPMIRINLVAGERRAVKAAGRSFQIGQKVTVAGSLILIVTVLLIGWRYWAHRPGRGATGRAISMPRGARNHDSREVLKQVADFEASRTQLQQRVALIDELRKGQNAPVHIDRSDQPRRCRR